MEIAIFFSALKVDHKHIKIIYDDDGRPSGEAFVILEKPEWAEQAR